MIHRQDEECDITSDSAIFAGDDGNDTLISLRGKTILQIGIPSRELLTSSIRVREINQRMDFNALMRD